MAYNCCNDLVKSNLHRQTLGKCRSTSHFERLGYIQKGIFGTFRLNLITDNGMVMESIDYLSNSCLKHMLYMIDNLMKGYMIDSWEFILYTVRCIQSFLRHIGCIGHFVDLLLNN